MSQELTKEELKAMVDVEEARRKLEIPEIVINEMPTKETLVRFLRKMHGDLASGVCFDREKGIFVDPNLHQTQALKPTANQFIDSPKLLP